MRRRFDFIIIFILVVFLLIDFYVFQSLQSFFSPTGIAFPLIYWLLTFLFLLSFGLLFRHKDWKSRNPNHQKRLYSFMGFLISMYIPKIFASFFFFINDLVELIVHEFGVFLWMGIIIGILLLTLILYGIVYGKFHFKTEKKCLKFENLPNEFNGLRIVHFSDLHIGSWVGSELKLQEAVNLINAQNPDLILFTGDLINNFVEELDGFTSILKQLRAKYGIYSVLGNHDYGDYFDWNIEEERIQNLENLKKAHNDLGFHLLLNDSAILNKKHSKIGIVGVENWGLPPFHQNGDLQKALDTLSETSDFNILLSHDPSHWNQKVLKRDDIDLTLSGHTHGMQFGIYTRKLKWSPAKWKYPEWGGLYEKDKHKLYVSTGLGFIGFPGRIGVRPRITLLELRNTSN